MYITLSNGEKVQIFLSRIQAERLTGTCFRGKERQLAGNFFRWPHFAAFLKDPEVQERLDEKLIALLNEPIEGREHRIELEFDDVVGWDSVLERSELSKEVLDRCRPRSFNQDACALFVPDGWIPAPKTSVVTVVMRSYLHSDGHWKFVIYTIYPGEDVGRLQGDMTERHGLVWLSWRNPGE